MSNPFATRGPGWASVPVLPGDSGINPFRRQRDGPRPDAAPSPEAVIYALGAQAALTETKAEAATDSVRRTVWRQRFVDLFTVHCPEVSAGAARPVCERVSGREKDPAPSRPPAITSFRYPTSPRLPQDTPKVDRMLAQHAGGEAQLLAALRNKYLYPERPVPPCAPAEPAAHSLRRFRLFGPKWAGGGPGWAQGGSGGGSGGAAP